MLGLGDLKLEDEQDRESSFKRWIVGMLHVGAFIIAAVYIYHCFTVSRDLNRLPEERKQAEASMEKTVFTVMGYVFGSAAGGYLFARPQRE